MGLETTISRIAVQAAVYWGTPTADGYGGYTFDDPVEISVRWESTTQLITTPDGNEYTSRATVYVTQDLDVDGYLFPGDLDDLESGEADDPKAVTNAYRIRRFDKVPSMRKTDDFVRRAYL